MDPNTYREQYSWKYAFSCIVKCGFCGASLTRRAWHSGSKYNKNVWFCISSSKYGKKNCPESKAIPEEVLESAFVESFRIITDDHKDVLEEFLQRTEAELHSDATLLEIERVKKEIEPHILFSYIVKPPECVVIKSDSYLSRRGISIIIPIAEDAWKCYSFHRQWAFPYSVVWCGNLTIPNYEKHFHCFLLSTK